VPERKEAACHWLAPAGRIATFMAQRTVGWRQSRSRIRATLAAVVVALVAMIGASPAAHAAPPTTTSLTLTSSINPTVAGQDTVLTVTLNYPSGTPTGNISVFINGIFLATRLPNSVAPLALRFPWGLIRSRRAIPATRILLAAPQYR
jgi:hypothetical protein